MDDSLRKCFSGSRLNGLVLPNRLIKAATFEGKSPGGLPGPDLIRFHERIAQGGIGMTTLAYCAAEADGRLSENTIYMHEGIRPELGRLIATVHAAGAKVSGQLVHCGNFTKNREFSGKRPLGPSRAINRLGLAHGLPLADAMSKAQIDDRIAAYGRAAGFMKATGFDAIEIHFGHGYGISQFISPRSNRRRDEYGGSLSNRMRFGLQVLEAIRLEVGEEFPLLAKISMSDGVKGGSSYEESVEIAAMLDAGGIDAIVCSDGSSSMNPMLLFHGDSLVPGLIENEKNLLMRLAVRLAGSRFFRDYPYRETYLFEPARRIRDRVQCAVCYVGGVCTRESLSRIMSAGFDFIQLGRALLFDPEMPKLAESDPGYVNGCTHCNRCATLIDAPGGIRCVLENSKW